jgi:hypothetical protein
MITLTFDEFQDGDKFPDDDEIELYIVKDRKKVLYIGISLPPLVMQTVGRTPMTKFKFVCRKCGRAHNNGRCIYCDAAKSKQQPYALVAPANQ